MKVLAVVLGAMVGVVPAFSQVSYGQEVLNLLLPSGEALADEELLEFKGGRLDVGDLWFFNILVFLVAYSSSLAGGASFHQAYHTAMGSVIIFNLGVLWAELNRWDPY